MRKETSKMALYMDIHRNVGDIKKEKIDEAHKKDLAVERGKTYRGLGLTKGGIN